MKRELVYCRRCRRRHLVRWTEPSLLSHARFRVAKCPREDWWHVVMLHERTLRPMPV